MKIIRLEFYQYTTSCPGYLLVVVWETLVPGDDCSVKHKTTASQQLEMEREFQ
ncbi:MAG: hypothetical protein WC945_03105 [Bacteroidales bacterium]